jgi:hypothetical protein
VGGVAPKNYIVRYDGVHTGKINHSEILQGYY